MGLSHSLCCCRTGDDIHNHDDYTNSAIDGSKQKQTVVHSKSCVQGYQDSAHDSDPFCFGGQQILKPPSAVTAKLPGDFTVSLDRRSGERLGVDIDQTDGDWLLVHKITGDGVLSKWNSLHPAQEVKVGYKIVEVNGISVDVERMVKECQTESVLDLLVRPTINHTQSLITDLCTCQSRCNQIQYRG